MACTTTNSIPAQGTIFDTFARSYTDVPINTEKDNAISTLEFLEATESMTALFDILGSVAFQPVKKDILGNVKKIRERQELAPAQSLSLQDLVLNELRSKKHTASEGLLWLVRGLDFTCQALSQNLLCDSDELSVSFRNAYSDTLKPHHSFLVKPIFTAAMAACPYRKTFYAKLGDDKEKVLEQLGVWLKSLENIITILKSFLGRKDVKW